MNVNTDKPAQGTIDGEKEIHTVGTRYPLSYGTGPTVWWKPVLVTSSPAPSPSPDNGSNSLCDELPNIMKSICSLTVLMHKVVDACYPPSSWPTQPYPDGCSAHGHKHKGCGCNGQSKD
ncbi:hypothetical protein CAL13_15585 [Bordetella genomosp. 9]|uniref:Uncharacterized protein n=1 Tax=Bordetella genomosp. 9 TaxID=1416803 RepID=A0A1W6Z269_9BORD|nr:hypothetical protein CAL13_15585 [Bordetella genomosp. 9]